MVGNLTSVQGAAIAAGLALGGITAVAFKMNSEIEDSVLRFKSLGMSSEEAKDHVKELFEFAKATPFESGPIIEASRMLRVMGGAALDTKEMLTIVGDAAASAGQEINEVAMWTGRAYSAIQGGRPFGEAAMRLQEMGLLSGTARNKLEELQKSGASSEVVFAALRGELEKAQGAMVDLSQTFSGRMSTAIDGMSMAMATGLKPAFDAVSEGLGELVAWMETPEFQNGLRDFGNAVRDAIPWLISWGDLSFQTVLTMKDLVVGVYELASAFKKLMSGDLTGASEAFGSMTARIGDRAEGWAAAVERASGRISDAQDEAVESAARMAAGFDGSTAEAGDSVEELSDRVTASGEVISTVAEGMATDMDAAYKQVQDSNDLLTEAMKKADEIRLADRQAAYDAGQALAEAASQDRFERVASDAVVEQEIRDKQYEAEGKALIKANEDAAKATEKINNEAIAEAERVNKEIQREEEKANNEILREQERAENERLREQEKAYQEEQAYLNRHKDAIAALYEKEGEGVVTSLAGWLNEGVYTVDGATREINELLGRVPPAVLADLQVFEDFKLGLGDMAPEWAVVLQPVIDAVNNMDEETREKLGLSIDAFERLKDTMISTAEVAKKTWGEMASGERWESIGAPATGRELGLAGPRTYPVPSDSPVWKAAAGWTVNPTTGEWMPPGAQGREWQPRGQAGGTGTTVHGDINIYARNDAATEINNLSALVR